MQKIRLSHKIDKLDVYYFFFLFFLGLLLLFWLVVSMGSLGFFSRLATTNHMVLIKVRPAPALTYWPPDCPFINKIEPHTSVPTDNRSSITNSELKTYFLFMSEPS